MFIYRFGTGHRTCSNGSVLVCELYHSSCTYIGLCLSLSLVNIDFTCLLAPTHCNNRHLYIVSLCVLTVSHDTLLWKIISDVTGALPVSNVRILQLLHLCTVSLCNEGLSATFQTPSLSVVLKIKWLGLFGYTVSQSLYISS